VLRLKGPKVDTVNPAPSPEIRAWATKEHALRQSDYTATPRRARGLPVPHNLFCRCSMPFMEFSAG
ncbi:hypothetical protein, partial [Aquabacterium sp. A08]|uniref:hypothetical protein n=1 Tax=Aquabacterium sp. A08 TaxID=2718532 RepID=UPI001AAF4E60